MARRITRHKKRVSKKSRRGTRRMKGGLFGIRDLGIKKAISAYRQSGIFDMSNNKIVFQGNNVYKDFKKLQNSYLKINGSNAYIITFKEEDVISENIYTDSNSKLFSKDGIDYFRKNEPLIRMTWKQHGFLPSKMGVAQFKELIDYAYGRDRFYSAETCFSKYAPMRMFRNERASYETETFDDIAVPQGEYKFTPEKITAVEPASYIGDYCIILFKNNYGPIGNHGHYIGPKTDYKISDPYKDFILSNGPENEKNLKNNFLRFKKGILKFFGKMNEQNIYNDPPEPDNDTPTPQL